MSEDVPGAAEMFRLLTRIDRRLDDMERRAAEREKDFVRLDVFEARQETDDVQMKAFENEVHSLAKRFDSADTKIDTKNREVTVRIDNIEAAARAYRMWLIGAVVLPLALFITNALLIARAI